ncbi:MAG: hypothetical protein B0W54_22965 [Cellvibrio sp. 79]|nr:MAG: hypothetical protein B0W54_22965 [Cellvibrio sp. 79]
MNSFNVLAPSASFHEGEIPVRYTQDNNVLGVVSYIPDDQYSPSGDLPHLQVQIPSEHRITLSEIWRSAANVTRGHWESIDFSHDGELLFGAISYAVDDGLIHANQTEKNFRNIFRLINEQGYPHLFRMWSYIPGLNQDNSDNLEIYKDFCFGRSEAFSAEFSRSLAQVLPAATGIGSCARKVAVYFLAKKTPDLIHIENPIQIPAYKYPPQYGVKAPSFARATYVPFGNGEYRMYLSGTASVVGHSSHHPDSIEKQCETTLLNIQRLIDADNLKNYGIEHPVNLVDLDMIKVYIRHRHDFAAVQRICSAFFRPGTSVIYLHADICRKDLLIELEGIFSGSRSAS